MDVLFEEVLERLDKLVHYLAFRYSNDTPEILMEKDELVGELYEELWKGVMYYREKNLPIDAMVAVLKVMMNNRLAELQYRYFKTHREISQLNLSLDVTITFDGYEEGTSGYGITNALFDINAIDPARIIDSADYVTRTRCLLSPVATEVFDAVVYGNEQLALLVWLTSVRAMNVYANPGTVKLKPRHLADALCITEHEANKAIKEIKTVVARLEAVA